MLLGSSGFCASRILAELRLGRTVALFPSPCQASSIVAAVHRQAIAMFMMTLNPAVTAVPHQHQHEDPSNLLEAVVPKAQARVADLINASKGSSSLRVASWVLPRLLRISGRGRCRRAFQEALPSVPETQLQVLRAAHTHAHTEARTHKHTNTKTLYTHTHTHKHT